MNIIRQLMLFHCLNLNNSPSNSCEVPEVVTVLNVQLRLSACAEAKGY